MKYRGFGMLECNVLCENPALAELGVSSDMWLPFVLDLNTIQGVKLAVDEENTQSVQHGCAQIFFKGVQECMVIDVGYHDMKLLWIAFKAGELSVDRAYVDLAVAFLRSLEETEAGK